MSSIERCAPLALALALAATVSGCFARQRVGWWEDEAFYASRLHYRVRYAGEAGSDDAESRRLLPSRWRLDNFRHDGRSRPTEALRGRTHDTLVQVDRDGDGRVDLRATEPRYELHFQHLDHDAVIWTHSSPLDGLDVDRSLEALLRVVVDAFAEEITRVGKGRLADAARRRGVRIVEEGAATMQSTSGTPVPARGVVFEIVDLDAQGPESVLGLVELLVARPDARWRPGGGPGGPSDPPMVVFFGFAARTDLFPTLRADFHGMLGRVDFRR